MTVVGQFRPSYLVTTALIPGFIIKKVIVLEIVVELIGSIYAIYYLNFLDLCYLLILIDVFNYFDA